MKYQELSRELRAVLGDPRNYEGEVHGILGWETLNPFEEDELHIEDLRPALSYLLPDAEILPGWWFTPKLLIAGDYNNSSQVEVANARAVMRFAEANNLKHLIKPLNGTYINEAVTIHHSALDNEDLRTMLEQLDDYPVIDEELLSACEEESIEKSWKDGFLTHDFITALKAVIGRKDLLEPEESQVEEATDWLKRHPEHARAFFEQLVDPHELGVDYRFEPDAYIDISKLIYPLDPGELLEALLDDYAMNAPDTE